MDNCIFCKIIKSEAPASKIYEDDDVFAFNSNQPVAETHILIIPKKHLTTFMDLDCEMQSLGKAAQKLIKEMGLVDGYRLIVNGGKYQEIQHCHLHLLAGDLDN